MWNSDIYNGIEKKNDYDHINEKTLENEDDMLDDFSKAEKDNHFESTYKLKSNENYDVNGYSYKTDKYGRISQCEGTLNLEDGKRNTAHQVHAGNKDRLETDEGGHIIAKRFNGSEKIDNIVPMDKNLNRGEYKAMENELNNLLKDGNQVDIKVRCVYSGESERPDSFVVKYKITDPNGNTRTEVKKFNNGKGR